MPQGPPFCYSDVEASAGAGVGGSVGCTLFLGSDGKALRASQEGPYALEEESL